MADTHWFDAANKALMRSAQRRSFSGLLAALVTMVAQDPTGVWASKGGKGGKGKSGKGKGGKNGNKNKNGGKKPNNKKPKKPPKPPEETPMPSICISNWRGENQQADRDWCQYVWNQCPPGGDEQFCIIYRDPQGDSKHAGCCDLGQACCDHRCQDIWSDAQHCGGCDKKCPPYHICSAGECFCDLELFDLCPGDVCTYKRSDPNNCGECGNRCPGGQDCVNGRCQCPYGGPCPSGQTCRADGTCGCAQGYKYCPLATRCVPENATCCGGLPIGYCFPTQLCCGSGTEAYCTSQTSCPENC